LECIKAKDFSRAITIAEEMISNGIADLHIYRLALTAHINGKSYTRASEINNLILGKYKLTADDYFNAGTLSIRRQDHELALTHLNKALLLSPDHISILNNIGYTLSLLNRHEEAIRHLDRAISLSLNLAFPYNNKGFAQIKLGDLEGALENIKKSISLDDKNAYAYRNLGIYCFEKGDINEAERLFKKAKELDSDAPLVDEYIEEIKRLKEA